MNVFVSCPRGMQYLLEKELNTLGLMSCKPVSAGVELSAELDQVYTILLWSRIANRVFVELASGKIDKAEDVYSHAARIPWQSHFGVDNTFSVNFSGTNKHITNSAFGALKVKDAIVDYFRDVVGERPNVDKDNPQIRVAAKLSKGVLSISLDLSGESLHKRGYRIDKGAAPLRENVAAALLVQTGWGDVCSDNASFLDPMCGSGTFCIEAALMAMDCAPGLSREEWGFDYWVKHDSRKWGALVASANERATTGREAFDNKIIGYDADARVISVAWENIKRAGLHEFIHVEKKSVSDLELPPNVEKGLLLTNPPYGERLGEVETLMALYRDLGDKFDEYFHGWKAGVFTSNEKLEKALGWRYFKRYKFVNGALDVALLLFGLNADNRFKTPWLSSQEYLQNPSLWRVANQERAAMLANRLKKNQKQFSKWAAKNDISCYRLYDADMPEFAFAIDRYESEQGEVYLYIQEYAPPKSVNERASLERLSEGLKTIADTCEVSVNQIFVKQRSVKKGVSQYEKEHVEGEGFVVRENGARIKVNIGRYVDTGLFLDHRAIRRWIKAESKGKKVLNLFSYTSVVSLHAALGGACSVLSVDMSQTYLRWAEKNFALNKLKGGNYKFERANCMEWLENAVSENESGNKNQYDLIFIDPPSFSNSKRMEGVFDVQADHKFLIESAMSLLSEDGKLVFSTNLRKFKLDVSIENGFEVVDFTRKSLDKDFERNQKIHKCWLITHESSRT